MSQPPAMTVVTRRALVRQLVENDPTLSQRAIAAQLGVSKDTVRRDLEEMSRAENQPKPAPDSVEPQPAPEAPPANPSSAPVEYLVLELDEPLREHLAVLRATQQQPDTQRANVRAARAAIRVMAEAVTQVEQHDREENES